MYDLGNACGRSMVESLLIPTLSQKVPMKFKGDHWLHFDSDHAGGYPALLENYQPEWIRASQSLNHQMSSVVQACTLGEAWKWQNVQFEVLWPPQLVNRAYNPHSCVIRIVIEPESRAFDVAHG
ncbi:hypothetical protein OH492_19735 [Vibrio chagasii]|nr:hypothetical protein [Vibrio chagasii]